MEYFLECAEFILNAKFRMFLLAIFVLLVTFLIQRYDRNKLIKRGIPSLKLRFFDILGHIKHVPGRSIENIQHPTNANFFQMLCGYVSIFKNHTMCSVWVSFIPFILLLKAEAVEELLRSTTILGKASQYDNLHPWLGTGLLTSKGSKWKSRRKLLTPSFHFEILKDFVSVFNEQCHVLVDVLKAEVHKEWIDIVRPITLCSLDIICDTTLGVPIGAQKDSNVEYVQALLRTSASVMARMVNPLLQMDFIFYNLPLGRQLKKDLRILHKFTTDVIRKKKSLLPVKPNGTTSEESKKRKALMDLLLDHQMNYGELTEEDIREEIDTFSFEGHDTTAMGISWTLYLIGLYPDVQKKIQDELDELFHGTDCDITPDDLKEMKYLECVIKESQRLYPSVPMFGRVAGKGVKLAGCEIPEGATLTVFSYMIHRDPKFFPNPEVFDPDRFLPDSVVGRHPYAFIPFSGGPRNCIGQRFAMMEMKAVIASILSRFDIHSLEPRDKITLTADLILRSVGPIKVKVSPRKLV